MDTVTEQLESGIIRLRRGGEEFLGFKISSSSRPDVAVVRRERQREAGFIVRGTSIEEWVAAGHHEHKGRYLIGPWLAGRSLEAQLDISGAGIIDLLIRVVSALKRIRERGIEIGELDASAIYLLDDGGVLLLPTSISSRQRACISESERRHGYEEINHPEARGDENLAFAAAVLAYTALAAEHPFRGPEEDPPLEELRQRMRTGQFLPLRLAAPDIASDGTEEIDAILAGDETAPEFGDLPELLRRLKGNLEAGEISVAERERRMNEARRRRSRIARRRRLDGFFRRNRVRLLVAAAVIAVVGSIAGTIIGSALEPPVTRGMGPEEVVRLFYTSINSFDHMTMEDCVAGDAGKGYIREATNLYVISRMRQGYEQGRNPYVDVREWIADDRPPLEPYQALYGVGNLSITSAGNAEFIVEYEKWIPHTPDDPDDVSAPNKFLGEQLVERVALNEIKGVWRITTIETIERRPLDPDQLRRNE